MRALPIILVATAFLARPCEAKNQLEKLHGRPPLIAANSARTMLALEGCFGTALASKGLTSALHGEGWTEVSAQTGGDWMFGGGALWALVRLTASKEGAFVEVRAIPSLTGTWKRNALAAVDQCAGASWGKSSSISK